MKGFVPTPPDLVDAMVDKLFRQRPPSADDRLLDPGCGTGAFIDGVLRWCRRHCAPIPHIVGVEADTQLLSIARQRLASLEGISLRNEDFLVTKQDQYDFIVGNPPYVPITGLSIEERERYRASFATATGRFDLYLLFFEQGLRLLKPAGRLVFVTPEKFLYVQTAVPLRKRLCQFAIEEIELVDEEAFHGFVTYPTVTTINGSPTAVATRVVRRDGSVRSVRLPHSGQSWAPMLNGDSLGSPRSTLAAVCKRISCGVATGADDVYVVPNSELTDRLRPFAFPTLAGREIRNSSTLASTKSMLVPYDRNGRLLSESELDGLGDYLRSPVRMSRLLKRTCVVRKPWYAFHENPPLQDILVPKIVCKDISSTPRFFLDERGAILPRHSVYYLIPRYSEDLYDLCDYLNSPEATQWLESHCQRATNGFFRLQSHVLKQMPIPERFLHEVQLAAV